MVSFLSFFFRTLIGEDFIQPPFFFFFFSSSFFSALDPEGLARYDREASHLLERKSVSLSPVSLMSLFRRPTKTISCLIVFLELEKPVPVTITVANAEPPTPTEGPKDATQEKDVAHGGELGRDGRLHPVSGDPRDAAGGRT